MIDLSCYDPNKWIFNSYESKGCNKEDGKNENKEGFYLYEENQRNPGWHLVRIGRPSGSTVGACVGHSNFGNQDDTALEICGIKKKVFDEKALARMNHGVEFEDTARDFYENKIVRDYYERTTGLKVKELGYIVPSWDLRIGVSLDGEIEVTEDNKIESESKEDNGIETKIESKIEEELDKKENGIIEIKCPQKMYEPLKGAIQTRKMGFKISGYSHIPITHYDQMQLGMAIRRRSFCDYIVYCTSSDSVFTQRIPFNSEYWSKSFYPTISWFCDNKIKSNLQQGLPLCPPGLSCYS